MTKKKPVAGEVRLRPDQGTPGPRLTVLRPCDLSQAVDTAVRPAMHRPRDSGDIDPERAKRLEELRARVRSGRYQPDIRDVALGLIRDDLSPFA
jgi:hypothetical protein